MILMRPKKQEPKHSASNIPLEPEPTKVSSASKDDPSNRMELRYKKG